jgi:hypothetical protein
MAGAERRRYTQWHERFVVRQRPLILLGFALCLAGGAIPARAQDKPAPPASSPDKPSQTAANAAETNPAHEAKQAPETTKSALKAHKVITNDDLKGIGQAPGYGSSEIDLSAINDCDRNCFERIRMSRGAVIDANGEWKHDLLQGIEKLSSDAKWQGDLLQIARIKGKFCDLGMEKNDALANTANPRNVTAEELRIDEEFDRKFKAAQQDFNAAVADADALKRTYSGIVVPFMTMQEERVFAAQCPPPPQPKYRRYQRPEPDDPDDP